MDKNFQAWHALKDKVHKHTGKPPQFKEREVWWLCMGHNVGFEQDGKGDNFERPVLIVKKFNHHLFLGVPLTSKDRKGRYYFPLEYNGVPSIAILSQIRAYSSKRILNKIGMVPIDMFNSLRFKLIEDVLTDNKK